MAQYRMLDISYVNDQIQEPGATVIVADSTIPGPHWDPMDDAAKKAFAKAGYKVASSFDDPLLSDNFGVSSPFQPAPIN